MGRKTNPKILRIGNILHSWDSKWFGARPAEYRRRLLDDLAIRRYLNANLRQASISRLEVVRQPRETILTIHTSRPAVVIGRGGSGIEKIQQDLKSLLKDTSTPIRINVQEVANPDTDARAVATQVVDQLEKRMPFRRILKQAVSRTMQAGALGVRVAVGGRLNGAEIARKEWLAEGNVPLQTFRADVDYAQATAFTGFGTIGVKVWINRGELLSAEAKPGERLKAPAASRPPRSRRSLAEKVKP